MTEELWRAVLLAAVRSGRTAYEAAKEADYCVGYYLGASIRGVFKAKTPNDVADSK